MTVHPHWLAAWRLLMVEPPRGHPVTPWRRLGMLLAVLSTVAASTAHAAEFSDDRGRRVVWQTPPARVVTLAPSLTEIVYAVGGGARVVGADTHSDHPPAARALPRVGDALRVDIERLLVLQPDLVLAWGSGNTGRELAQIEAAGVPVFSLEPRRLDDVPRALERVGALLGLAAQGAQAAGSLRRELSELRSAHAARAPVSVFYQVWSRPLMTLNDQHLIADVIQLCGGRNVFGALKPLVPELSTESVLAADPEVLLSARETGPLAGGTAQRAPGDAAFALWAPHKGARAVQRGWMFTLPGDTISRQGPRIAVGARAMCAALDEVRRERDGGPR